MNVVRLQDCPPLPFLKQVANHCAKAVSTYIYLWENRNDDNQLSISKDDVKYNFHHSAFKDNLRKLSLEGLINFHEASGKIFVELIDWSDVEEE